MAQIFKIVKHGRAGPHLRSYNFFYNPAITTYNIGFWKFYRSPSKRSLLAWIPKEPTWGKSNVIQLLELNDIFPVVIDADKHNFKALAFKFPLKLYHRRKLFNARWTPCRPKTNSGDRLFKN